MKKNKIKELEDELYDLENPNRKNNQPSKQNLEEAILQGADKVGLYYSPDNYNVYYPPILENVFRVDGIWYKRVGRILEEKMNGDWTSDDAIWINEEVKL